MNPETIEHIFEPFFSTKDLGKGTGLGLATVYGIVKQHQGFIHVESFIDVGTTFSVYLPVGAGAPQTRKGIASALELERGTETILLAEDNEGLREIEKEMLESLGYTVITTQDGEDAVETFSRFRDSVDLLLLDIVMPKLDGPAAYAKIAALKKDPPVIFMTGYAAETSLVTAKSLRNVLILQKPCTFATLAHKTRQLLDESRSIAAPSDPADSSIRGA
jgi:CheY-like chemotaxis protein